MLIFSLGQFTTDGFFAAYTLAFIALFGADYARNNARF